MSLITKGPKETGASSGPSPYHDARREWNERYGSYIRQRDQWRNMAMICGVIALVSLAGNLWQSSKTKVVPYLVTVDRAGNTMSSREAMPGVVNDDLIRSLLAAWTEDWRTVSVDAGMQQKLSDNVYAHLSTGSPAYNTVQAYYANNNPWERAAKQIVSMSVRNVLHTTKDTYQIDWDETIMTRKGTPIKTESYRASMSVVIAPPTDEQGIMRNATGLYVNELSFSQQLSSTNQ